MTTIEFARAYIDELRRYAAHDRATRPVRRQFFGRDGR